jgi:hypothetical protein
MPNRTLPKGHPSLLGAGFKYTPAVHTDLAQTFARVRERQQKETKTEAGGNVRALPLRKPG